MTGEGQLRTRPSSRGCAFSKTMRRASLAVNPWPSNCVHHVARVRLDGLRRARGVAVVAGAAARGWASARRRGDLRPVLSRLSADAPVLPSSLAMPTPGRTTLFGRLTTKPNHRPLG